LETNVNFDCISDKNNTNVNSNDISNMSSFDVVENFMSTINNSSMNRTELDDPAIDTHQITSMCYRYNTNCTKV